MPIVIPEDIPAYSKLLGENIFVMNDKRAFSQDIRPLEIAILNLMPTKVETETQFMRLLSNSPLQVNITLVATKTYKSKNTTAEYLDKFYKNFDDIKDKHFDGMIITGAPVETMAFEDVKYWEELKAIFDFADKNVTSTIYICWGAQAALYYHYGITKSVLPAKVFGVFPHTKSEIHEPLFKGIDDVFYIPHSRHTTVLREDIEKVSELEILASSKECGVYAVKSKMGRQIFVTGHSEYDAETLKNEYLRDVSQGKPISVPKNYFPNDDPELPPIVSWRSHANLLFSNWLNYFVYQTTPYDIKSVAKS